MVAFILCSLSSDKALQKDRSVGSPECDKDKSRCVFENVLLWYKFFISTAKSAFIKSFGLVLVLWHLLDPQVFNSPLSTLSLNDQQRCL